MKVKTLGYLLLEKLLEFGELTIDAFLPRRYPEARLWRNLLGLDPAYEFSPRTFSAILSRLRRQGLVERRGSARKARWAITAEGMAQLEALRRTEDQLPPKDSVPRLVIFDIPERERKKRNAVRRELTSCEFQQFQKSVWIGHRPLPEDFFEFLDALNLRKYVHVVSIRELGTLGE